MAAGALAATVLSKLFALVLLPLLLRRMGRGGLALFLLVLAIGLLPFADAGPDLVSGLTTFGKQWEFNAGLYSLLAIPLGPRGARAAAAALLLALAGFCFCREETSLPILLDRLLGMLALLLLLSPVVDPWYVTWLLPLLVVRPFGPLIAWTGLVALHYCYFIQDADQWWIRPLQYLPLYVYLALEGWRWCRRSGIVRPAGK